VWEYVQAFRKGDIAWWVIDYVGDLLLRHRSARQDAGYFVGYHARANLRKILSCLWVFVVVASD
jgi:hypothetical protein